MRIKHTLISAAAIAGLAMSGSAFANVGGGATIHNAASLTFSGGQVTDSVDVSVLTIGIAPSFSAPSPSVNSGDVVNVSYQVTSNSNGSDSYDFVASTNDTGVSAPTGVSIAPSPLVLGGSITSTASTAGTIYIPAGSEANFTPGDIVRINIGVTDYTYTVGSVTAGTAAFTVGNTTNAEVPTAIALTPIGAAPAIVVGNVPVGTQVGEEGTVMVTLTAGGPTSPGVDGTHDVVIDGTAAEPGPAGPGDVVVFTDTGTSSITVLSGDATLVKEVRNVTDSGSFATTGVTARTGNVLEYRLTVGTISGQTVTGAFLVDSIPSYTTYSIGTTTLNGSPVGDVGGTSALVTGIDINSATGGTGVIVDGETAVILFRVLVD